MPMDLYEKVDRAAGTGGGRSRLGISVWQLVAFVGVSLAAAAYLCGECCGKACAARSAAHLTLVGHDGAVRTVLFGRDGSMLGSVGANGTIAVWDLDEGQGYPLSPAGPGQGAARRSAPTGGCWRPAGPTGRSCCTTWRRARRSALIDPTAATAGARCLAFAPDGRTLAVGRRDGRIALWDMATRRERPSSTTAGLGHAEVVNSLAYSPDGGILASSGGDRSVRLWDAATGRPRREIAGQPGMFVALAFTPDSRILALADQRNPFVRLWDLPAGMERPALHGAEAPCSPWRSAPTAAPSRPPTTMARSTSGTSPPAGSTDPGSCTRGAVRGVRARRPHRGHRRLRRHDLPLGLAPAG